MFCKTQWVPAKVLRVNKKTAKIYYIRSGPKFAIDVPFDKIWKGWKKPAIRKDSFGGGKADCVLSTKRIGRHRKLVEVVPTIFDPTQVMGNFGRMLNDANIRSNSVCIFNDNTNQWEFAGLHPTTRQPAGGGNAIARPWEYLGDAIGIPTGPYASLTEMKYVQFPGEDSRSLRSAKEIIDEAFKRVVRKQLANPDKDIFYYSADENDGKRLGLGIFANAVGDDVVEYHTKKLQDLPYAIQKARVTGVAP
ncbi:MAG: hypothetical protein CL608_29870 [Anaerolineaceae bacterium]|nr:hypothetical protein [Anaerolineaceae bacterium]